MTIDFKMKAPIPKWEALFKAGRTPIKNNFKLLKNMQPTTAETLEDVRQEMADQDINHAVILGRGNAQGSSNAELYEFLKNQESNIFHGFIGIEDLTVEEAVKTIHKYAKTNVFSGVSLTPTKIEPHTHLADSSLHPIFDACLEYDFPIVITLSALLTLLDEEADYDYIHPKHLIPVLQKYPELNIIISHAAWPFVQDSIAVAVHFPNLYLCPDLYIGFPGSKAYAKAANSGLEEQILFASCYPNVPYDFALKHYKSLIDPSVIHKVLHENAAKLLKIES